MSKPQTVVCICGGGNGAHLMTGLASAHAGTDVRVLTLHQNEAADWREKLRGGELTVARHNPTGEIKEIKSKPNLVTDDASKAVQGADVIIFCVPAFAHEQYFAAIAPFVADNTSIIGLPGQPGFEFQCFHVLKDKAKSCAILNYESLPWACRIAEFGRKVDLLGTKDSLLGSQISGTSRPKEDPILLLQSLLGERPVLRQASSYLEITLATKAIVHPPIMFSHWNQWDGSPLQERPLFYQGLSGEAASLLASVSEEIVNTAKAITKARPDVTLGHVEHLESWLIRNYRHTIGDPTSLHSGMQTNSAYYGSVGPIFGLVHPMKEISPNQWVPDFNYRFLTEDVPFGLAVTKGVAQIIGLSTPNTDRVLTWAQGHLGKEFMVGGSELKGKDVAKETRAPQAYGLSTLEELLSFA